ncbi:MAG: SLBB domain-containing protein [Planctomycetota bacterium]
MFALDRKYCHGLWTLAFLLQTGCSTLGISLYPTGSYLTSQAEEVLDSAPAVANLPKELSMDVLPAHFLTPGDVLLIEPERLDSDVRVAADQRVLVDGTLDLGPAGRVVVAGQTIEAAEQLITELVYQHLVEEDERQSVLNQLGEDRSVESQMSEVERARHLASLHDKARMNIWLLESTERYYVLGEVNSPGTYSLAGNQTVLDGILEAGGLTSTAAPCKILLARPTRQGSCRAVLPVCYREITQLGEATTNYQLKPGDRIYVAARGCCDELMFWKAGETCDRCCRCQNACRSPETVVEANTFSRVVGGLISPVKSLVPSPGMPEWSSADQPSDPIASVRSEVSSEPTTLGNLPPGNAEMDGQLEIKSDSILADGSPKRGSLGRDRIDPMWLKKRSADQTE